MTCTHPTPELQWICETCGERWGTPRLPEQRAEAVTTALTALRAQVEGLTWTVDQSYRASPESERVAAANVSRASVLALIDAAMPGERR